MFYGYQRAPYDPACGGWKPVVGMGVCGHGQHKKNAAIHVPRFTNVTKVEDYHLDGAGDPVDPAGVAPYSRPDSTYPDCYSPGDPLPNSLYKCGPWPIDERPSSAGAGQVLIDYNVYERIAEETMDFSVCRKIGFKLVQARKVWHGVFGFTSVDNGVWGEVCDNCGCDYRAYQPTPDQTKYLDWTVTSTFDVVSDPADLSTNSVCVRTMAIDRLSGVKTMITCSETGSGSTLDTAKAGLGRGVHNMTNLIAVYCQIFSLIVDHFHEDITDGVYHAEAHDASHTIIAQADLDIPAGTAHYEYPTSDDTSIDMAVTSTTLHYVSHTNFDSGGYNFDNTLTVDAALSNSYTAALLESDRNELLATWPLNNDIVYPWRIDAALEVGPIVSRKEVDTPAVPTVEECGWTDSHADLFDGMIQGAPLPQGYGAHFDFDHYNGASPDGSFGKLNPGPAPATATRWTPDVTSQPLAPGGWWRHSVGGVTWAQKWAEILVRRPRYNFFGPWGKQRYSLDEERSGCVTGATGAPAVVTVAFVTTPTGAKEITTGTVCYYGGAIYEVTRNTDTEYEMTTLVADVPVDAQPDGDSFGPLRFPDAWPVGGRVVVASATQNGGNVDVVVAGPGRGGDASWLRDDDTVDFTGVGGLGAGLAVTVVDSTHFSVPGTLSGAYTGGGYIKSTGAPDYKWFDTQPHGDYVTATWAHDFRDYQIADYLCLRHNGAYCVCDNDDFYLVTCPGAGTTSDVRALQATHGMAQSVKVFTPTQRCLGFTPCDPQVVCFSPNPIDTFKNGTTIGFSSLTVDDTWGSAWQAAVQQNMSSPDEQNKDSYLWQPPHAGCAAYADSGPSYSFNWNEDDGSCLVDSPPDYYFPQRNWFECRLTKPTGAPDLPTDVKLGFASLSDLDVTTLAAGTKPVFPPPTIHEGVSGVPLEFANAPWIIALAEENCVCTPGRFADEYEGNAAECQT